jgi:hypothetical protein
LEWTDVSEVHTASNNTALREALTYAPLKLQFTPTRLHGAKSQKTPNFILAAVRT